MSECVTACHGTNGPLFVRGFIVLAEEQDPSGIHSSVRSVVLS